MSPKIVCLVLTILSCVGSISCQSHNEDVPTTLSPAMKDKAAGNNDNGSDNQTAANEEALADNTDGFDANMTLLQGNNTANESDLDYDGLDNETTTVLPEMTTLLPTQTPTLLPNTSLDPGLMLDDFCLCDLKVGYCDVNCCCDMDCGTDDRRVFSQCLERPQNVLDSRYCYQEHTIFSSNTEYKVQHNDKGVLCIVTDNLPQRTTYKAVKGAETLEEFEQLERERIQYSFDQPHQSQPFTEQPYREGEPVWGMSQEGYVFNIGQPASVVSSECETSESLHYLRPLQSSCLRVFQDLPGECQTLSHLNALHYLSFLVVADPSTLYQNVSASNETESPLVSTTTEYLEETTTNPPTTPSPTDVPSTPSLAPPMEAQSPPINHTRKLLQSEDQVRPLGLEAYADVLVKLGLNPQDPSQLLPFRVSLCNVESGKENCTNIDIMSLPQPHYANGTCHGILSSVHYHFVHNGTRGITNAQAKVFVVDVSESVPYLSQSFETGFSWVSSEGRVVFERSGHPGYVFGKPLLLGRLVTNTTEEEEVKEAIELDLDPNHWLSVLSPGVGGTCTSRTLVGFGTNVRTGCVMEVSRDDITDQCPSLQSNFLDLLLGPTLADTQGLRVATYGDSDVNNAPDWVPILLPEVPRATAFSNNALGKATCAELIMSLHLEVAFSLQGALANPQAKVVGVVLRFGEPQDLELTCAQTSCQNQTIAVELVSSVAFVDVTKPPLPAFAQPPALDVKLPYDFFYPFLPSSAFPSQTIQNPLIIVYIFVILNTVFIFL